MTTESAVPPFRRVPWLPLLMLAGGVLLAGLMFADARLKRAPVPGYAPPDTGWAAYFPDAPAAWDAFLSSHAGRALGGEAPELPAAFEREFRLATGIRPTPARLGAWLGRNLLFLRRGGEWGVCAYPGLLLRGAEKIRILDRWPHAWKNGCVLFASSAEFLSSMVASPPLRAPADVPAGSMCLWRPSNGEAWLMVELGGNLALSARSPLPAAAASKPGKLSTGWRSPPAVELDFADTECLTHALSALGLLMPSPEIHAGESWKRLAAILAGAWQLRSLPGFQVAPADGGDMRTHLGIALHDVDTRTPWPVPVLSFRSKTAGAQAIPPLPFPDIIPHSWEGHEGGMLPLFGNLFSLCFSSVDGWWIAATTEPLMAGLMAEPRPLSTADAAVRIKADWEKCSGLLLRVSGALARAGWMPGWDEAALGAKVEPWAKMLNTLGTLEITGRVEPDCVVWRGHLASPGGKTPKK